MASAIIAGAAFGVLVYIVDFYGFTALFPWFAMARRPINIVSHAVLGAFLGGVTGRSPAEATRNLRLRRHEELD